MVNRTKDYRGPKSGSAIKDGYTVLFKRPRSAAPGNMVLPERADSYDDDTAFMMEFGGRSAARRRYRDLNDDDSFD